MECNKDEAVRAMASAEGWMLKNDFVQAQKLGLKAQKLFPELDNISQLLTVCDVHCSSLVKLNGTEMDWYGILQVQKMADEATIKRQYRKLALLLHPDKNKFAGAEAAFKLIGEANRMLTDQEKRSVYDSRLKFSVRNTVPKAPPHQVNKNHYARPQPGAPNVTNSQYTGFNVQQPASAFPKRLETFWTCCPYCNVRFQYYTDVINKTLKCQNCSKLFTAYVWSTQNASQGPRFQPGFHNASSQGFAWKPTSSTGVQGGSNKPESQTEPALGSGNKPKSDVHANTENGGLPKTDAPKVPKNASRKRSKPMVVESSESSDSDESVDVNIRGGGREQDSGFNTARNRRTSARSKRNVSYAENASDDDYDDLAGHPKASKFDESSDAKKEADNDVRSAGSFGGVKEKESAAVGQNVPNSVSEAHDDGASMEDDDNGPSSPEPEADLYQCPDPEFSDFDKDKADHCYAVDQIWAVYDTVDGMPRYYVRIARVFPSEFKLRVTWLEPRPFNEDQAEWVRHELPIACGNYTLGSSQDTTDRPMFSHRVDFERGKGRRSYVLYPREGETWALFKDWDIGWSANPEEHQSYEYEIVEVLFGFEDGVGIRVGCLDKIKGFVSLFQPSSWEGVASFTVPPEEIFRFSHRIPSFRMSGTEREGVPSGCYELDTAALPSDLLINSDRVSHMETENKENKGAGTDSCATPEGIDTPRKSEGQQIPRRSPGNC